MLAVHFSNYVINYFYNILFSSNKNKSIEDIFRFHRKDKYYKLKSENLEKQIDIFLYYN